MKFSLKNCFDAMIPRQRYCILEVDEVYVKQALMYSSGELSGLAVDNKKEKAKTVLGILLKCFFGGRKCVANCFLVIP